MKRQMTIACVVLAALSLAGAPRPTPEYLKRAVVYQIVLRNFTRGGNFRAAAEMLDHVRSVGVDVVYLSPFVEMDRDMDESGWSPRQRKSGFGSPKNCYRISDYNRIDPEYGKDEDFRAFNDRAHELGLKVYMDLVYAHCGPNNVIRDSIPDAFQRNPDGSVRMTEWNFPYLNHASKAVRKYLIDSMLRWMSLGCDGFRCDVGDLVPVDFWEEAARTCQKVRGDIVMIDEGSEPEWIRRAFDAYYSNWFSFSVRGILTPGAYGTREGVSLDRRMDEVRAAEARMPPEALGFCFVDNHDMANDDGDFRFDRAHPVEAGNAAFTLVFLRRGLPVVFNGNEIADNSLNSFFGPVEHPARAAKTVDWGRAMQPAGRKRLGHIRALANLRHTMPVFSEGTQDWVTNGEKDGVVAFVRRLGGTGVFVAANISGRSVSFSPDGVRLDASVRPLLSDGASVGEDGSCSFAEYGFVVVELPKWCAKASLAELVE